MELKQRIIEVLRRGPMVLEEISSSVPVAEEELLAELGRLVGEGLVKRRRSNGLWIYWLDEDGCPSLRDWEVVEGLTVLQVLEEASRLA